MWVICLVSCASKQTITNKKVRATSGVEKYTGDYEYTKDKNGMIRATSDKQSDFSKKGAYAVSRDYKGKSYGKENYRKKRWGNNTGYNTKQYGGNLDGSQFKNSPHYVQKQALAGSRDSRFNRSEFGTNSVSKTNAREGSANTVKKGQSGYVSNRGDFSKKRVLSKKQYAELTIQQTNSLLGRE